MAAFPKASDKHYESIQKEIFTRIEAGDINATLELADILFERRDYTLARVFYFIVDHHGSFPKAFDRLMQIEHMVWLQERNKRLADKQEKAVEEINVKD